MLRITLVTGALFITLTACADRNTDGRKTAQGDTEGRKTAQQQTESQYRAKEVIAILQSQEVQELLELEDGPGNFREIKYVAQDRTLSDSPKYEVVFRSGSFSFTTPQICTLIADVDRGKGTLIRLSEPTCVDALDENEASAQRD